MAIVGGNIDIAEGNLRASSGQINIASVASVGDVTFDMGLDTTALSALGSIMVTEQSRLVASGAGGQIVIRGGN